MLQNILARVLIVLFGAASIAWCENHLTRRERKEGFELLFDGRTLEHWHSIRQAQDAGSWRVRKGVLTWDKGGSWLATDETFYDFVLRLEYRTRASSASGIFLRAAAEGDPAVTGIKLAIPDAAIAAKPDGEWNHVEISLIKRDLVAMWNGRKVLDLNLDEAKYQRSAEGHIGLEASAAGAPVEFRNIRIKVVKAGRRLK